MKREWATAALDLQAATRAALADLGGVDLARSAEDKPAVRAGALLPVLERVGVLELDPLGDEEESSAAVLAVRACGECVAPWPVTRVLSLPAGMRRPGAGLYVVDGSVSHLDHADVLDEGIAVRLEDPREVVRVRLRGPRRAAPLDPFGTPVELAEPVDIALSDRVVHMSLVLDAFWVAGALTTVATLAARYAKTRRQFGKSIGKFGEIRWRLADMAVATDGLDELAAYTWFLVHRDRSTVADALALRVGMHEAAEVVLRNGHQVLGAIGLCDEHDLSVIDRHLTSTLLRPAASTRTTRLLLDAVNRFGFRGTFDVLPRQQA